MMLSVSAQGAKRLFFDVDRVVRAADKGTAKALRKIGSFIHRSARSSIRKRKRSSKPGEPPSSHRGTLRDFLFFSRGESAQSVLIGPVKTNQAFFNKHRQPVRGTVPQVLEFGGQITILEVFRHGRWQRADLLSKRSRVGLETRYRTVNIRARPFMGPALRENLAHIPEAWRNVISNG